MPITDDAQLLNRRFAEELIAEAKINPHCRYMGKFVGIVNGQVAVEADDWDDLARRLRQIEPDPAKTFCVEVGRDYDAVEEIWGWY